MTRLGGRDRPLFARSDEELVAACRRDFRDVLGFELDPFWTNVAPVPTYSPDFYCGLRNPPVRSASWRQLQLYFAGSYHPVPPILSTGTALASALEAEQAMVEDRGLRTDLEAAVGASRPLSMTCA